MRTRRVLNSFQKINIPGLGNRGLSHRSSSEHFEFRSRFLKSALRGQSAPESPVLRRRELAVRQSRYFFATHLKAESTTHSGIPRTTQISKHLRVQMQRTLPNH